MLRFAIVLAVSAMSLSGAAMADEVIATHSTQGPVADQPSGTLRDPAQAKRQADGDWARGVLAGNSDDKDGKDARSDKGCVRNPDRNSHGEAWAGVGTGGYNNVGMVVTQPLGDCGQVTIAASHTDYGNLGGRRGRR